MPTKHTIDSERIHHDEGNPPSADADRRLRRRVVPNELHKVWPRPGERGAA